MAFELRLQTARLINMYGINTLDDINCETLRKLSVKLTKTFQKMLIFDPRVQVDKLKAKEETFMLRHQIFNEWEKVRSSTIRRYRRNKFNNIIQRNIALPIQVELMQKLNNEIELFLS